MAEILLLLSLIGNIAGGILIYHYYLESKRRDDAIEVKDKYLSSIMLDDKTIQGKIKQLELNQKVLYPTMSKEEKEQTRFNLLVAKDSKNEKLQLAVKDLEYKLTQDSFAELINASQRHDRSEWKSAFLKLVPELVDNILNGEYFDEDGRLYYIDPRDDVNPRWR